MDMRFRLTCRLLIAVVFTWLFAPGTQRAWAVDWQWSVTVPSMNQGTERPRAFLWIPPDCQRVRGVVFGQHNMQEEPILESPEFRKALADLGFAEVWVAPGFDAYFRFDKGAGEKFDAMMKALADESGYAELAYAPVVPIGHSAAAMLPEYFAAWKPERTLAYLSISGQWPFVPAKEAPQVEGRNIDGVPGLVTIGEYEWADQRVPDGTKTRAEYPKVPLTMLACPADGHFEPTDEKVNFLAFYLRKAVEYRLPAETPTDRAPDLKPIDPTTTGWLIERWHFNKDPSVPPAPVDQYTGDPKQAFWCFDEETARAIEAFQALHRGKSALIGYLQDGQIVPQNSKTHQQVTLKFLPEQDGITFKLTCDFIDTVPDGRPTKWTGQPAGATIEKPVGGPPIEIRRICGPIKKLSADTFALDLNRESFLGDRRGNEALLVAIWPGNDDYKRMVQQSKMVVPARNAEGTAQKITFPEIADVTTGTTEVKLGATSDANMPVHYFVLSGPAEMDGDTLKLLPVPPRAKYPVKVTVDAWQWGRSANPQVQSAEPVERTFSIVAFGGAGR
jgi:hypothetical protein